jgi:hypothetical protein
MRPNRTITQLLTHFDLPNGPESVDFRVEIAGYFRVNGAKGDVFVASPARDGKHVSDR